MFLLGPPQKRARPDPQCPAELHDDPQRRVPHAALDAADVGTVEVGLESEPFLGEALPLPLLPQRGPEGPCEHRRFVPGRHVVSVVARGRSVYGL